MRWADLTEGRSVDSFLKPEGRAEGELRTVLALLPPVVRRPPAFQSSDSSVTALMVATAPSPAAAARPATPNRAVRMLGRYQLLRLLGKSAQTMLWLALDTNGDIEVMVALPRVQPPTPTRWAPGRRASAAPPA
jgi:hypothetical protein